MFDKLTRINTEVEEKAKCGFIKLKLVDSKDVKSLIETQNQIT